MHLGFPNSQGQLEAQYVPKLKTINQRSQTGGLWAESCPLAWHRPSIKNQDISHNKFGFLVS